jgi:hypothetical protein
VQTTMFCGKNNLAFTEVELLFGIVSMLYEGNETCHAIVTITMPSRPPCAYSPRHTRVEAPSNTLLTWETYGVEWSASQSSRIALEGSGLCGSILCL